MKEYLDGHDIANSVRMMRSVRRGAFLIVEGGSDSRVYGRFTDEGCEVVVAGGKTNALNAMHILQRSGVAGVLAIVDSDFWSLDGVEPDSPDILVTDTHDLETMIIASGAFDVVLTEFGDEKRIRRLGAPIREALLDAAMPLAYLRWLARSDHDKLPLRFKNISFTAFITVTERALAVNIDAMLAETRRISAGASFDVRAVKGRILALLGDRAHDPWQVSRGHDVVEILALALREGFGNRAARTVTLAQVDRILRIAYNYREFSRTALFAALTAWEGENPGYRVLARV